MKKRQLRRNKNKFKRVSLAFFGLVIILAGALFLFLLKKKKAGVEDGKAAQINNKK